MMTKMNRRVALGTLSAVAMTQLSGIASANEDKSDSKTDSKVALGGCITIQLKDVKVSSDADVKSTVTEWLAPLIISEILRTQNAPKTRGCSVSGTVSHGTGGTSGSASVTCTL